MHTQVLLREKAMNTEQVLQRNNALKEEMEKEQNCRKKAENEAKKLKTIKDNLCGRVEGLEREVDTLKVALLAIQRRLDIDGGGPDEEVALQGRKPSALVAAEAGNVLGKRKEAETQSPPVMRYKRPTAATATRTATAGAAPANAVPPPPPPPPTKRVRVREEPAMGDEGTQTVKKKGKNKNPVLVLAQQTPSQAQILELLYAFINASEPSSVYDKTLQALRACNHPSPSSSHDHCTMSPFMEAIMTCAVPAPTPHWAPSLPYSPRHWFTPTADTTAKELSEPPLSFTGLWCRTDVLKKHTLLWLLRCAIDLGIDEVLAKACARAVMARGWGVGGSGSGSGSDKRCAPVVLTMTEACALATVCGVLYHYQGNDVALQAFIKDLTSLSLAQGEEEGGGSGGTVAVVAAAMEPHPHSLTSSSGLVPEIRKQLLDRIKKSEGGGGGTCGVDAQAGWWLKTILQ